MSIEKKYSIRKDIPNSMRFEGSQFSLTIIGNSLPDIKSWLLEIIEEINDELDKKMVI